MMTFATQAEAVLVVMALLGAVLWGLRRASVRLGWGTELGSKQASRPLRITAQLSLTPQHRLHQVETPQGERYVLATHPAGIAVISASAAPASAHTHAAGRST